MSTFTELDLDTSPIEPGLTVIEASAGTGKTYSISHLVPRLLLTGELPDLSRLLLVTFTKDAARELADRVRRVLTRLAAPPAPDEAAQHPHVCALRRHLAAPAARARLDRALLDLDLLAVSTIHAFCQRTLQQEGTLCGLPVMPEVITDDAEHLAPLVRARWLATLGTDPVLAALATARDWQLEDALRFLNSVRRCLHPEFAPAPAPFARLRRELETAGARLAAPAAVAAARALIGGITTWNKGVADAADALRQLAPLFAAAPGDLAFWQALPFAADLTAQVKKNSNAGKAAAQALLADPWFTTVRELAAAAHRLEWAWHQELAAHTLPELARALETRRLITQDGLIGALHRALHRPGPTGTAQSDRLAVHLARRYHVALIDESQDTDPRQFAIFRRIFLDTEPRRRLILVGDPKQAIYGFRGADLSTYLAARAGAGRGYTLTRTHRAPAGLVTVLNQLFQRDRAFHHPDLAFPAATSALTHDCQLLRAGQPLARLEAWLLPPDDPAWSSQPRRVAQLSARIASTIVDLLHHGALRTTFADGREPIEAPLTARDFAVLVSTHAQAAAMAEALQARAVPAVVNSGADVFASEEARELHTVLRALLDPRSPRRLRAALATRLFGLDAAALAGLDAPAAPGAHQPSVLWAERFAHWHQTWHTRGLAALFSELEDPAIAVTHRLAVAPLTGERRATNLRHLTDLLLAAARTAAPRPAEVVRWLGQEIARADDRSFVEEHQLQLSSDRAAVQIVTMHKAKGLEYPLVFCPYLADPLRPAEGLGHLAAPRAAAGARPPADLLVNLDLLEGAERETRSRELLAAQLEERLRLAYVALTRARVRAWICSYRPARPANAVSALDWLLRSAAELAAYPGYHSDWAAAVAAARGTHHGTVLAALGAGRPDAIEVRDPPPASPDRAPPAAGPGDAGAPPLALPAPIVPPGWRITSFSTLTREKHAHGAPLPPAAATPADRAAATPPPAPPAAVPPPRFFDAPGGAAVGTVVHDWIETWDFAPPDATALASHLAGARLPALPPDQADWGEQLAELFTQLRTIRLPGCGDAPLSALCPEPHGSEWHFHLPLAGTLGATDLARCFEHHAAPAHRPYAAALRELSEEKFTGLLQGFIDRLVRHGPAWGVIDWKTNRLGPSLADYDEAGLLRCAMRDHYLLQAHLYLVALRRYLRALGLADPPLAGAWLVFLRALAPGGSRGVLHLQPPREMLDALDALFAPGVSAHR
jgi:exodeoxyribonuclease V beta subunit